MRPRTKVEYALSVVDKYRPQVRADFSRFYGVDLAQLVADKRYLAISDYLDMLPQHSYTTEALLNDPDYAMAVLEAQRMQEDNGETSKPSVPLSDWDPIYQLLTQLNEQVTQNTYTLAKINGAKPSKPKPMPRPRTAIDEAREQMQREEASEIYAAFGRATPDFDVRVSREQDN